MYGALLSGEGEEGKHRSWRRGHWLPGRNNRWKKACSGSWKVRAQVGFVSPGSTGAAGCLCLTSSHNFLAVGKINQPWISRDWFIYPVLVTCFRRNRNTRTVNDVQMRSSNWRTRFSPLKWSLHDVCPQVWVRKKLLWTVDCSDQMLLYTFRWKRQYHGCRFSIKLSPAHQHRFCLLSLLSCFPSISWSYLSLGHGMSCHEVVHGEGWVELSVIFWSCYCLLLMNFLCFVCLGKWKVPSLNSCQPCEIPLCNVLRFPILSSGIPLN